MPSEATRGTAEPVSHVDTLAGPGAPGEAAGTDRPYRVVPFDKNGACTGPRTRDEVVADAAEAADVFVFSHGWNNDWDTANDRYRRFVAEYSRLREESWPQPDRDYRPLAVGVFWPSTALVAPWERAPDIAGAGDRHEAAVADLLVLGDVLVPPDAERAYELADREWLSPDEARELAELLVPGPRRSRGRARPRGDECRRSARGLVGDSAAGPSRARAMSAASWTTREAPPEPGAAGLLDRLDPPQDRPAHHCARDEGPRRPGRRDRRRRPAPPTEPVCARRSHPSRRTLVRREGGPVGALRPARSRAARRIRAAPAAGDLLPTAFATAVPGTNKPGGYVAALERSAGPIVTTFSKHDVPLTTFFHLGARRAKDLGEAVIAGVPPSRYAALGGFGPQGRDADTQVVQPSAPPTLYRFGESGKRSTSRSRATASSGGTVTSSAPQRPGRCSAR